MYFTISFFFPKYLTLNKEKKRYVLALALSWIKKRLNSSNMNYLMYAVPKHLESFNKKFQYKIKSHNLLVSRVTFSQPHTAVKLGIIQLHTDRSLSIHQDNSEFLSEETSCQCKVQRLNNGYLKEGINQLEHLLIRNNAKLPLLSIYFF